MAEVFVDFTPEGRQHLTDWWFNEMANSASLSSIENIEELAWRQFANGANAFVLPAEYSAATHPSVFTPAHEDLYYKTLSLPELIALHKPESQPTLIGHFVSTINTDGRAALNATVLTVDSHTVIVQHHRQAAKMTKNEADWNALIELLLLAKRNNIRELLIYSDSKIVFNQFNKLWKPQQVSIKALARTAWHLVANMKIQFKSTTQSI